MPKAKRLQNREHIVRAVRPSGILNGILVNTSTTPRILPRKHTIYRPRSALHTYIVVCSSDNATFCGHPQSCYTGYPKRGFPTKSMQARATPLPDKTKTFTIQVDNGKVYVFVTAEEIHGPPQKKLVSGRISSGILLFTDVDLRASVGGTLGMDRGFGWK